MKKAGNFDALFCTGSFFGLDGAADAEWQQIVSGASTGMKRSLWG